MVGDALMDRPCMVFHRMCMSEVISSLRSLRAGSQVFALLMLFVCVILHTMSSGKSLCIFVGWWFKRKPTLCLP